jgi:glycosyltransferase involved in cell wall biosynthesis
MNNHQSTTLFIGAYLSKNSGTKSPTEFIAEKLTQDGYKLKLVSNKSNFCLRVIEVTFNLLLSNYSKVFIDVYSNKAFGFTWLGCRIARLRGKKIYLNLHGGKLAEFAAAKPKIVHSTLKIATRIFTPSYYLKHYFEESGLNVEYLPNPINLDLFTYNRTMVKPYSILWVRAFHKIYNPEFAIEIFNKIQLKYPNATLTMVGPDKGERSTCLKLIQKYKITDKIYLPGKLNNNELTIYYHNHAVFINTTSYESFGMAILEAASSGIPIVSFNVGELSSIWNDKIRLIEHLNKMEFCEAIEQLFNDKDISKALSITAREKAETFSWTKIKPYWTNLLK